MTDIQQQIAQRIDKALDGDCGYGVGESLAAVVMPLVKRAQAEALRDAADEIEATFTDPDRRRPRDPKGEVATDYVNDPQWAELVVRNRAGQIEKEAGA